MSAKAERAFDFNYAWAVDMNYNHLYYFWLVGKHSNLTRAARRLGLAQPTVSAQIRSLEAQLNVALLTRRGRHIELTQAGQILFRLADEMFRISAEIPGVLAGKFIGQPRVLHVGTSDFVPKPIIRRILEPLLQEDSDVRLVCREWEMDELFDKLGLFRLDLVIADRPHPPSLKVHTVSHPVLESAIAMYARPALARKLRKGFPRSLHGAPLYLPVRNTVLRESLDRWMAANHIQPLVLAEFEDRELLKTFGGGGLAAFPATALIESEVRSQFGVERVGWVRGVRETYYAIAMHRRVMHPVVQHLFAKTAAAPRGAARRTRSARKSGAARRQST